MTYFQVLAIFIVPPLLALLVADRLWLRKNTRGMRIAVLPYLAVALHIILALVYTTPWDNYLVATGVWWYDPALVTGLRLGWVPIEEYTFFVLQTLLTGLWTLMLFRLDRRSTPLQYSNPSLRMRITMLLAAVWVILIIALAANWNPLTYMLLILSWALIPMMIQTAFGADILIHRWRTVIPAILAPTLYLWWVDSLAITAGTWTINPAKTTGLKVGSLPVEEMLFFLLTNVIIVFGMTLILSPEAQARLTNYRIRLSSNLNRRTQRINT